jgi:hypothetical protein
MRFFAVIFVAFWALSIRLCASQADSSQLMTPAETDMLSSYQRTSEASSFAICFREATDATGVLTVAVPPTSATPATIDDLTLAVDPNIPIGSSSDSDVMTVALYGDICEATDATGVLTVATWARPLDYTIDFESLMVTPDPNIPIGSGWDSEVMTVSIILGDTGIWYLPAVEGPAHGAWSVQRSPFEVLSTFGATGSLSLPSVQSESASILSLLIVLEPIRFLTSSHLFSHSRLFTLINSCSATVLWSDIPGQEFHRVTRIMASLVSSPSRDAVALFVGIARREDVHYSV